MRHGLSSSDRVRVGVVGLGLRGFSLLDDLLKEKDVDVIVVCDVDQLVLRTELGLCRKHTFPALQALQS